MKNKKLITIAVGMCIGSSAAWADFSDRMVGGIIGGVFGSMLVQSAYHAPRRESIVRYTNRKHPRILRRRYRTHRADRYRDYRRYGRYDRARLDRTHLTKKTKPTIIHKKSLHKKKHTSQKKHLPLTSHAVERKPISNPKAVIVPLRKSLSSAQKIQNALKSLGFYHGSLDGELRSYETHAAIREMHYAYKIGQGDTLDRENRYRLIALGELFLFDRALIDKSHTPQSQIKQIQTALKIHGLYKGDIDGIFGSGTRSAIKRYKKENDYLASENLDLESKYMLITSAKKRNEEMIDGVLKELRKEQKRDALVDGNLLMHPSS